MATKYLEDMYSKDGAGLQEFVSEVTELASATEVMTVPVAKLHLHFPDSDESKVVSTGKVKQNKYNCSVKKIQKGNNLNDYPDEIIKEADRTGLYIKLGRQEYPVSVRALETLSERAGITGPAASMNSLTKTMFIADVLQKRGGDLKLITRKDDEQKKVFAVMSADYTAISQKIAAEITMKSVLDQYGMGKAEGESWHIDHDMTSVWISFPEQKVEMTEFGFSKEKTDAVPGILIETSDTGNCAFRVLPYVKTGKLMAYIPHYEYKKVHSGKARIPEILKDAETVIFPNINRFPKMIEELTEREVVLTDDGIEDYFNKLIAKSDIRKVIGKKRAEAATEAFASKVRSSAIGYSVSSDTHLLRASDVFEFMLGLQEMEMHPVAKRNVAEAVFSVIPEI